VVDLRIDPRLRGDDKFIKLDLWVMICSGLVRAIHGWRGQAAGRGFYDEMSTDPKKSEKICDECGGKNFKSHPITWPLLYIHFYITTVGYFR